MLDLQQVSPLASAERTGADGVPARETSDGRLADREAGARADVEAVGTASAAREPGRLGDAPDFPARVLDAIEQTVIAVGLDGTIRSWNRGAERLYGWPAAEALGRDILAATASHAPGERADLLARLRADERWSGSLEVRRRDGTAIRVRAVDAPMRDADGTVLGLVRVSGDGDEHRATERKAELADQQRAGFLASAAHDLKNGIAGIRGYAQLLRRHPLRDDRAADAYWRDGVRMIEEATTRMDGLADEVLDLGRLQMGHALTLHRHATDLVALARRSVDEHQTRTTAHRLRLDVAEDHLVGRWDAARLDRVLANLLSNAIKYSPAGGAITVHLRREGEGAGARAVLSVQDEGLGIPAAELPRLFEPFHRGSNVGQIPGAGIGLASVRQIAEEHQGTVGFQSVEGAGSAVTIRVPINPAAAEP